MAKFREGTIKALQAKLNGQEGGEFVDIFEPERVRMQVVKGFYYVLLLDAIPSRVGRVKKTD